MFDKALGFHEVLSYKLCSFRFFVFFFLAAEDGDGRSFHRRAKMVRRLSSLLPC